MKEQRKLSLYKKDAWNAFSLYIRTRDSLLTTGGTNNCVCVSCGKTFPRLGVGCIQAGHFIAGRTNAVLFSEEGVHGQCGGCNNGGRMRGGSNLAVIRYYQFMLREYGQETIDRLILESNRTVIYKSWDYEGIRDLYTAKTMELLKSV